ncbi:MAG: serine hydrolase, partial [Oligoflexales bacterium]|nr:serine hydrolase [Oligoflexales bacterium]
MNYAIMLLFLAFSYPAEAIDRIAGDRFEGEIEEYNYFSNGPATFATVCLGDDCQAVASGYTGLDHREKVTTNNLISIGSNSKYITAALILIQIDQGYM